MALNPQDVLFEFRKNGNAVKVSAIDPVTNTEISIVGPANAPVQQLKMNALRKLQYVIAKDHGDPNKG